MCPPPRKAILHHEFLHRYILNPKHKLKRGLIFHTAASQTHENNNKKREKPLLPSCCTTELVKSTGFFFNLRILTLDSSSLPPSCTRTHQRSVFMSTVLIYSGCWRRVIPLFLSFCLEEMTTPHTCAHTHRS